MLWCGTTTFITALKKISWCVAWEGASQSTNSPSVYCVPGRGNSGKRSGLGAVRWALVLLQSLPNPEVALHLLSRVKTWQDRALLTLLLISVLSSCGARQSSGPFYRRKILFILPSYLRIMFAIASVRPLLLGRILKCHMILTFYHLFLGCN